MECGHLRSYCIIHHIFYLHDNICYGGGVSKICQKGYNILLNAFVFNLQLGLSHCN